MTVVSSRIKPLSVQLANQIAAGEVVERPASVVKELLENAIDAQSSRIDIDIERGGSALIRISDNGFGINKDDLTLAVTRHATSKLHTLSELEQVSSLGFRGEALASISAVSKLSIKSKQAEQQQGWMIDTGTESDFANYSATPEPVAHPQGTTIEVCDMFYNTPARRKFMRTVKTEFKHIDDIVKRIALSQFNIAIKLTHNKKLLRNLPKAVTEKAIAQRISKLFSPEFLSHSKKVDFTVSHFTAIGEIRLWGWISAPQWHRKQADWQYFYVNGRYIKDKLVNHALRQAYQELLPADTYSAYLLYLEISPQQVDVNVHPTKHEVRFRQARLIHDFIYSALNQAINPQLQELPTKQVEKDAPSDIPHDPIVNVPGDKGPGIKNKINQYNNSHQKPIKSFAANYQPHIHSAISQNNVAEHLDGLHKLYHTEDRGLIGQEQQEKPHQPKQPGKKIDSSVLFGDLLDCSIANFVLTQKIETGQTQLFVIKVIRAQQFLLKRLFRTGQATSLLIPQSIFLSVQDIEKLLKFQSQLNAWGLELSQLTADTLLIRSLPSLYGIPGCEIETERLIGHIIPIISADFNNNSDAQNLALLDALANSLSVNTLNTSEQAQLLNFLSEHINKLELTEDFIRQQSIWVTLDQAGLDSLFN